MCGIAGEFVLRGDRLVQEQNVIPMISILAHRGSDEWGYYVNQPRTVMLLHTRLSIVDLAHGRQPLANEDGTVWISFNGEIYDFQRMARELESQGHRFRTKTDTEVIVHLYEEYGEDFVDRLRGEFALALYDQKKSTLLLVRDRFGIKPLYYSVDHSSLIFASEMKAIFRHPKMAAELDYQSLPHIMCGVMLPSETPFKNVRQVEPGCFIRIEDSEIRQVKYWDFTLPLWVNNKDLAQQRSEEDFVEEFRDLLEEAIRLRLHGDVEVGVYLSGGIDSSSVARTMARLSKRPVKAFTIAFENTDYDEAQLAESVAQQGGLEHHVIRIGKGGLAHHFTKSLWHSEIPVLNSHGTAKFLLSALASRSLKAVLTGEGADELLVGYNLFKHQQLLEELRKAPRTRQARRRLNDFLASEGVWTGITKAKGYKEFDRIIGLFGSYPYTVLRALIFKQKVHAVLSRSFREMIEDSDPVADLAASIDRLQLAVLPPIAATQYVLFKTDLPGYILNFLGDREEMAHSIEGRTPFLDHKLVEFAWQLPLSLKLKNGSDKYILRRAFADLLPIVSQARKKMFLAPSLESLGLDERNPIFENYFSPSFVREVGIFDPVRLNLVRRAVRCLPRRSYYHKIFEGVLVFALSLHVIYDLFCRNFPKFAEQFSRPALAYDLREGSCIDFATRRTAL